MWYQDRPLLWDYMKNSWSFRKRKTDISSHGLIYREPVDADLVDWLMFTMNQFLLIYYTDDSTTFLILGLAALPIIQVVHWCLGRFEIIESMTDEQENGI